MRTGLTTIFGLDGGAIVCCWIMGLSMTMVCCLCGTWTGGGSGASSFTTTVSGFGTFTGDGTFTSETTKYRVKSGIFGQTAKFGQRHCLFHISNIGIKNKLTK